MVSRTSCRRKPEPTLSGGSWRRTLQGQPREHPAGEVACARLLPYSIAIGKYVQTLGTVLASPLPAPADLRRFPRRAVSGIQGTLRSPGDVKVLDLSLIGLAAELSADVKPGDHCFLELRHGRSRAMVETVVKWRSLPRIVREPGWPPLTFRAGMAFVDIDRDGPEGIWSCILPEAEA